jgi:O-acetyl-ADP-ribose deacetylase (regulator of RNase III)
MPLKMVRQDITEMQVDAIVNSANEEMQVDAIVNSANEELQMGGGVCGAIFRAAGAAQLQAACDPLAPIRTGEAVTTAGFALPAKWVIHAVGPVYRGGGQGEAELLRACYTRALARAVEHGCKSVAFPLISSGNATVIRRGLLCRSRRARSRVFLRSIALSAGLNATNLKFIWCFGRSGF